MLIVRISCYSRESYISQIEYLTFIFRFADIYYLYTTLIRRIASIYSIGRVDFFKIYIESSNYYVTYPLNIRAKVTITLGFKIGFYRRLLVNTIRATISITIGANSYSINPYLEFYTIVPFYSPAFQLLNYRTF